MGDESGTMRERWYMMALETITVYRTEKGVYNVIGELMLAESWHGPEIPPGESVECCLVPKETMEKVCEFLRYFNGQTGECVYVAKDLLAELGDKA